MKFITIIAFTCVLMGLVFTQSVDPTAASSENPLTTEGYVMNGLQPMVKGLIDGFRVLMLQVRFVRILFENFGVEMGRIARNSTIMPTSGSGLPFPFPSQYGGHREEPSSEPNQPVSENTITAQFQEIFDRWGVNTAVAFRGLLSEVAHVYQDAVATLVKQGEVSRNQVVQSYNTIRSAMTSISQMIQDNFPTAESVATSINNMSQSLSQNVTSILSGIIPDGLPTGLPTGIPNIAGLPTLPSLPTLPNLQDLIPTTLQSGSTKKNN